ncbi:TOBE domain-containing protein [Allopusillimonas ginsengisoli]|uniref:TOBE domain-containing protein n=1 Tax=Allopusillimonas ginsengisoli TaxID=453575 RepID=UPI001021E6CD|nr:TOBE domain-containing protein [Allopusillimonas ginsengisoli]TEA79922.1 LysR family transcriptional regulator [Allopusillimonas ginsengisoli]
MSDIKSTSANETPAIELTGSIAFRTGEQNWGSQRRMALLGAIAQEGSISAAARKVGLSYKAAWDAVDTMNNLAGEPLVMRTTGGRHGGGATLSERAVELLNLFDRLNREHQRFLAQLAHSGSVPTHNLELIQHIMIQTSARNNLSGTVASVKHGAVNDEIILNIAPGLDIVANITSESARSLDLEPGRRALAFIKASSIIVGKSDDGIKLSARNQLAGRISEVKEGAVNAEARIELPSGQVLVAVLTMESLSKLALKAGDEVYAIFKASSVMLGVTD